MNRTILKKLKIFSTILTIFLFIFCAYGQSSAEKYFLQAYECKDLDCQIKYLSKSIESNPKYAPAFWGRSYIFFLQNKHSEKKAENEKASELSPDYIEISAAYDKAANLFPANKYILVIQGDFLLMRNQNEQALSNFNKAIKIDPKFAAAYFNRSVYFEYRNEFTKALEDLAKAIELSPEMASAHYRHGAINALNLKNYEKGIAEMSKAIELNPNLYAAYSSRAIAYNFIGKTGAAIADLTKYIEFKPNRPEIYRYRATIYDKTGEKELAQKDRAKADELESKKSN